MVHRWNYDSMKPYFLGLLHFDDYENEMNETNDDDNNDDDAFDYSTSH